MNQTVVTDGQYVLMSELAELIYEGLRLIPRCDLAAKGKRVAAALDGLAAEYAGSSYLVRNGMPISDLLRGIKSNLGNSAAVLELEQALGDWDGKITLH